LPENYPDIKSLSTKLFLLPESVARNLTYNILLYIQDEDLNSLLIFLSKKNRVSLKASDANNLEGNSGVLYLGVDLGTSKTNIVSSNGIRESTFSMVGYPKDVVSENGLTI